MPCVRQGLLPVTQAGYVGEVETTRSNRRIRWDVMLLGCDREIALERCALRGDTDLADRAWTNDHLASGLRGQPLRVLLHLQTDTLALAEAAVAIIGAWEPLPGCGRGGPPARNGIDNGSLAAG